MRTTRLAAAAILAIPALALAQAPPSSGADPRAGKGFIATPVFSAAGGRLASTAIGTRSPCHSTLRKSTPGSFEPRRAIFPGRSIRTALR